MSPSLNSQTKLDINADMINFFGKEIVEAIADRQLFIGKTLVRVDAVVPDAPLVPLSVYVAAPTKSAGKPTSSTNVANITLLKLLNLMNTLA